MEENINKEMQEEEHGVTFGAICRVIFQWKRLLAIVAFTVICAVVAALFVKYLINPKKTQYQVSFTFHVARVSSVSDLYESGQFFAEEETLTDVKNSDERFSSVNVSDLLPGGKHALQVSLTTETRENGTTDSYYTIVADQNAFGDTGVAEAFLHALIGSVKQSAVKETQALAQKDASGFNGYEVQLKNFGEARTYEEKLSLLVAQRDYLIELCDSWIESYGELYYLSGKGVPLVDLREAVRSSFSETEWKELTDELSANAYVPNVSDTATLQIRLNTYKEQKDLNEQKIAALKAELDDLYTKYGAVGTGSSLLPPFETFYSRIATLIEENAELQKKIDTIMELIGEDPETKQDYSEREEKFGASVQSVYTALAKQAERVADVAVELATKESFTTLLGFGTSGGTSPMLVAVVVAVLAFIVSAAVCYIVFSRRGKGPQEAPAPQEQDEPKTE